MGQMLKLKKFKSFKMIGPFNIHYYVKSPILDLIVLKDGKLVTISTNKKLTFYDKDYNFLSEFILERNENGIGDGCLTELEDEDLVITFDCIVEIRKKEKEKNEYSKLKRISYDGRVCLITTRKLNNNRFIISRLYMNEIQIWDKDSNDSNYKCIYEGTVLEGLMFNMNIINENLFFYHNFEFSYFYTHDFKKENNKLLKTYKSAYNHEEVNLYDFTCKLKYKTKSCTFNPSLYNNKIYLIENSMLIIIDTNDFKETKYKISFKEYPTALLFLSNERFLASTYKEILEFKFENDKIVPIKRCSDKINTSTDIKKYFYENKNGDIICFSDRILFFDKKQLIE